MEHTIYNKRDISEIVDSYGDLIGKGGMPSGGSDLESQANRTTDYNIDVSAQPFRYDMLGRFGFTMLPFFEGKEDMLVDDSKIQILTDLATIFYDHRKNTLKYYFKNPNKLKSDYRLLSNIDFDSSPDDKKEINYEWAKKIISICDKYIDNDENDDLSHDKSKSNDNVVQERVLGDKNEDEFSQRQNGNDIRDKKLTKIAGLINKLDKRDVNKLITLLEVK